jgi:hypothetical protein
MERELRTNDGSFEALITKIMESKASSRADMYPLWTSSRNNRSTRFRAGPVRKDRAQLQSLILDAK